jgi:hypothetical protein
MSQRSAPGQEPTGRPPDELYSQTEREEQRVYDEEIDEASAQSFPASDSPSSTSSHAGPPVRPDSNDAATGAREPRARLDPKPRDPA